MMTETERIHIQEGVHGCVRWRVMEMLHSSARACPDIQDEGKDKFHDKVAI
jgi:hypothetical protein